MTARWAFAPVCGFDFWRVIVTSPEVLIFVFFMLTDPKTVPAGRVGRVAFGCLVAVASTLLMAPQTNEFGTKVALLGGLVVMCAVRPVVDRLLPKRGRRRTISAASWPGSPPATRAVPRFLGGVLRNGMIGLAVLVVGIGIVAAGTPARGVVTPGADDILGRVPHDIDPSTLPAISVEQDVLDWNHEISGPGVQEIVLTLAENLELENQAVLRADPAILDAVDHGDRLDEMELRIESAAATGTTVVEHYQIDEVNVTLLVPFGQQTSLSLGLDARGTVTEETYEGGRVKARTSSPFAKTFVLRQVTGGRWLNVAVLPQAPRVDPVAVQSPGSSSPPRARGGLAAVGSGRQPGVAGRRTPRRLRRTSWTTAPRAVSTTATRATSSTSSVAASPRSTATRTGAPTCSSPAGAGRRRSTATRARSVVRCASPALTSPVTDSECGHRCLPARRRQRRPHRSRRPARRRGRHPARGWALRVRASQRGARPRRRRRLDGGVQRDVGGGERAPTLAFGDYLAPDRQTCEDSRLVRPAATGDGYGAPLALTPGYCTLSMLFSDWRRSGSATCA